MTCDYLLNLTVVISIVEKIVYAATSMDPEPEIAMEEPDEETTDTGTKAKLFSSYRKRKRSGHRSRSVSAEAEMRRYLIILDELVNENENPLKFWADHCTELPKLARLARKLLVVPATSAPVERVFSHGGIIIRPHRAKLSDSMLSALLLLKCNRLILNVKQ